MNCEKLWNGKLSATLKIRGGVRQGLLRQESRKGCADSMGEIRDAGREPRSDAVRVVYGIDQQGGKGGANYLTDVCPTILSDSHGTPNAVCYGISPYTSCAIMSDNPHSGIYVAETARTLDLNGGNPACNQGGVLVLERKCYAVDCRNGTINECVNGTLQSKEQGYNTNSNNVVLVSSS